MPSFLLILFLSSWSLMSDGFMFDSMAHMKRLVALENHLQEQLHAYIDSTGDSFGRVQQFAGEVHNQTKVIKEQGSKYLDNPINAYAIIKRFTDGWSRLHTIIKVGEQYEGIMKLLNESNNTIPTKDNADFYGAIKAIFRLQNTYNLTAKSIIDGNIPGCQATIPLTADDCYEFGAAAYKGHHFSRSLEWLKEGERLIRISDRDERVTLENILEYLAWVEYLTGHTEKALNITQELIQLAPDKIKYHGNDLHYRQFLEYETPLTEAQLLAQSDQNATKTFINSTYSRLCRGEHVEVNVSQDLTRLRCWYENRRHDPRLLLKPIKLEQISLKPKIFIIREFVAEDESKILKEISTPMLNRATVFNTETKKLENAEYRVAKSAWLQDHMSEVVKRINTRASVVTGLDRNCAEHLQIGNYGMGGHYETHFDYGDPGSPIEKDQIMGNRIATLLIYLNNVASGGATVFVEAGLQVLPSKGDAVFWYNLKRNGDGDPLTAHAGCPVLCGNKWVANKWFRIRGNIFSRPCALDKNI